MGFLDKAKAAANDLAAKADTALAGAGLGAPGSGNSGEAETHLRDLGVLAYLEATGRAAPAADRDRVLAALNGLESRGAIQSFTLRTAPSPAPGTASGPTAWGAPPAPGAAAAPPAPGAAAPPPAPAGPPAPATPPAPAERPTAPPPPSWASGGNG